MTFEKSVPPGANAQLESSLWEAAKNASQLLEPNSLCILCRKPLVDEDCPEVSDIDLIVIYEKTEEYPERITVQGPAGRVFVDILWIPISPMLDASRAASYKILPHLLLESETVWMRSDSIKSIIENVKTSTYDKQVWEKRIHDQIDFGNAALNEASKNLDYPPASLFFLHAAHSYYLMALADCLKHSTMGLLTKPVARLRLMANETDPNLEKLFNANLHLDNEPSQSFEALKRIYDAVSKRCSNRVPHGVSGRTRGHYTYSISATEFEYRKMVIQSMIERRDYKNANFYIRFWAYSFARCPVVLEDAQAGKNPSFYVPFGTLKESVEATCPEIIGDLGIILGSDISKEQARQSIDGTVSFRQLVVDQIRNRGLCLEK